MKCKDCKRELSTVAGDTGELTPTYLDEDEIEGPYCAPCAEEEKLARLEQAHLQAAEECFPRLRNRRAESMTKRWKDRARVVPGEEE